jgi:hypothetical protein
LSVVLGSLAILGCGGGSSNNSSFVAATTNDLANNAFAFASGPGPNLSSILTMPQGQAFTLGFGATSGGSATPVTLTSVSHLASGNVTLGAASACTFAFDQSTFEQGSGPQVGNTFTLSTCAVDGSNHTLQLKTASGETVVSSPASARSTTNVALVLTTNFTTGSYSLVDLTTRTVSADLQSGGVHSDAVARLFNGKVYVVNRQGQDTIQLLDPQRGFFSPPNGVLDVGDNTNPQDIVFISDRKAYVSRLASSRMLIIDPTALVTLGEVDLRSLVKANDGDGRPEAAAMLLHNGLVYVALQHIDFTTAFPPTKVANGEVAVIDPATDTIARVIPLHGRNPFSTLQFSPTLRRILVSSVGDFTVPDGGIEAIDPDTNTVDPQFVIAEDVLGGDITAFTILSRTTGFAVVSDTHFANTLIAFDPSRGVRLNQLVGPLQAAVPHVALNSRNQVYLAVTDTQTTAPGLRLVDAVTGLALTKAPLSVGTFPPAFTLCIE